MPRNAEVIRQWTILREIERARAVGVTIDDLAALCGVTTRTIRRDLQALEEAGFPVYDDRSRDDGRTRWLINGQAFKGLSAGLTLSVWYPPDKVIELEPIGPRERLAPGASASFTEDWWLLPHPFPKEGQRIDLKALAEQVEKQTTITK